MTWLWTSLIVIGVAMIVVAVWPSIRRRGAPAPTDDDQKPDGV
jgi:hypothetical protein